MLAELEQQQKEEEDGSYGSEYNSEADGLFDEDDADERRKDIEFHLANQTSLQKLMMLFTELTNPYVGELI